MASLYARSPVIAVGKRLDTIDVAGVDVNLGNDPRQQRDLKLFTEEVQLLSPEGEDLGGCWVLTIISTICSLMRLRRAVQVPFWAKAPRAVPHHEGSQLRRLRRRHL